MRGVQEGTCLWGPDVHPGHDFGLGSNEGVGGARVERVEGGQEPGRGKTERTSQAAWRMRSFPSSPLKSSKNNFKQ